MHASCGRSMNWAETSNSSPARRASMAFGSFSPPKGWEDWATLVLGILLWAIPIILQFKEPAVLQNFLIVGFLVIFCELFAFYFLRSWEERINISLGIWLMVST